MNYSASFARVRSAECALPLLVKFSLYFLMLDVCCCCCSFFFFSLEVRSGEAAGNKVGFTQLEAKAFFFFLLFCLYFFFVAALLFTAS